MCVPPKRNLSFSGAGRVSADNVSLLDCHLHSLVRLLLSPRTTSIFLFQHYFLVKHMFIQ